MIFFKRDALRTRRTCKNRPNAPVIGIRVGLSVVAVQVEIAVVVPIHVEPITGRELATPQTRMLPVHLLYLEEAPSNSPPEGRAINCGSICQLTTPPLKRGGWEGSSFPSR